MDPTLSMDPSGLTRTPPKDLLSMGNVDGQLGGAGAQNPQVITFTIPEANKNVDHFMSKHCVLTCALMLWLCCLCTT